MEPAFELVDEGLGARIDTARPAIVRAAMPLLDPAAVRTAERNAEALGRDDERGISEIGPGYFARI